MNTERLFTRAVAALPEAVRNRLDAGTPLDWSVLEDPGTGARLAGSGARSRTSAGGSGRTCQPPGERRRHRTFRPSERAWSGSGSPRSGSGRPGSKRKEESYCVRSLLGGETRTGVRPEVVAGYAMLALELAAAVHEAAEHWIEAGERHRGVAGGASSLLGLCAVRMREQLRPRSGADWQRWTTAELAGALERSWNTQDLKTRAALSAIRLRSVRGARAPMRSYYAPMTGYRLHSFDPGEILWLRGRRRAGGRSGSRGQQGRGFASGRRRLRRLPRSRLQPGGRGCNRHRRAGGAHPGRRTRRPGGCCSLGPRSRSWRRPGRWAGSGMPRAGCRTLYGGACARPTASALPMRCRGLRSTEDADAVRAGTRGGSGRAAHSALAGGTGGGAAGRCGRADPGWDADDKYPAGSGRGAGGRIPCDRIRGGVRRGG